MILPCLETSCLDSSCWEGAPAFEQGYLPTGGWGLAVGFCPILTWGGLSVGGHSQKSHWSSRAGHFLLVTLSVPEDLLRVCNEKDKWGAGQSRSIMADHNTIQG